MEGRSGNRSLLSMPHQIAYTHHPHHPHPHHHGAAAHPMSAAISGLTPTVEAAQYTAAPAQSLGARRPSVGDPHSRTRPKPSTSYRGVSITPSGKYRASVSYGGRRYHLGMFSSADDAARAYDRKAIELGITDRLNLVAAEPRAQFSPYPPPSPRAMRQQHSKVYATQHEAAAAQQRHVMVASQPVPLAAQMHSHVEQDANPRPAATGALAAHAVRGPLRRQMVQPMSGPPIPVAVVPPGAPAEDAALLLLHLSGGPPEESSEVEAGPDHTNAMEAVVAVAPPTAAPAGAPLSVAASPTPEEVMPPARQVKQEGVQSRASGVQGDGVGGPIADEVVVHPLATPSQPQPRDGAPRVADSAQPFTSEEDLVLRRVHRELGGSGSMPWENIARTLPGRSATEVQDRWAVLFNTTTDSAAESAARRYTKEENSILLDAHAKMGSKWSQIATLLPGRKPSHVKAHFRRLRRKRLRSGVAAPGEWTGDVSSDDDVSSVDVEVDVDDSSSDSSPDSVESPVVAERMAKRFRTGGDRSAKIGDGTAREVVHVAGEGRYLAASAPPAAAITKHVPQTVTSLPSYELTRHATDRGRPGVTVSSEGPRMVPVQGAQGCVYVPQGSWYQQPGVAWPSVAPQMATAGGPMSPTAYASQYVSYAQSYAPTAPYNYWKC
mmetsp:Transcript_344/g.917  ORF Transcript_344/g.917 Transcript_344/m.917 type:complete len:664 (-) Transcript_344:2576-4567(-)